MASVPWRAMTYAAIAVLFLAVIYAPDPNAKTFSTLSTEELIQSLSSPRDSVRRAASGQLIARAKTVVPQLERALPAADDSQRRGLFDILEELLLSSDPEIAENGEGALERLMMAPDRHVADGASQILVQNSTLRHTRAVIAFTELGGRLESTAAGQRGSLPTELSSWAIRASNGGGQPLAVLDKQWMGGDPGLKHLARMFPNETIALHLTDDAPVSKAGLAQLRARRDRLAIRHEQESCLGIIIDPRSPSHHVVIIGVVANSPAERGGLQTGDVIIDMEGQPVREFDDLGQQAMTHRPGELIRLTIRRNDRTIRLRMPLGSDFRTGRCQCVESSS